MKAHSTFFHFFSLTIVEVIKDKKREYEIRTSSSFETLVVIVFSREQEGSLLFFIRERRGSNLFPLILKYTIIIIHFILILFVYFYCSNPSFLNIKRSVIIFIVTSIVVDVVLSCNECYNSINTLHYLNYYLEP